ncbi:hypothetical protein JNB88_24585 [Rhizobium cauense]|uniref:hypothetical protein n=1 Tax=Rhizobium cauense TaxID=1166683 RepID=UPI001C6F4150|nr:hypothetical protein [Rhizobium cauense]MBW9116813.1 hypothetical protein [Rhizobium cauense]
MSASRHFARLSRIRDQLEAQLLMHEARDCFDEYDHDGGLEAELRERITEIGNEISSICRRLEYRDGHLQRNSRYKPGLIQRALSSLAGLTSH